MSKNIRHFQRGQGTAPTRTQCARQSERKKVGPNKEREKLRAAHHKLNQPATVSMNEKKRPSSYGKQRKKNRTK